MADTDKDLQLLWITPKWPLPAEDGARRATVQLVKSLVKKGCAIHLCPIVPEGEPVDPALAVRELGVERVSVVRRHPSTPAEHLKNLLTRPLRPLTVSPYGARAVALQFEKILSESGEANKTLVFDGLHAAGWLASTPAALTSSLKKIYRAHNVESALWVQGARRSRNPLKAGLLAFQASRMRAFERRICRESVFTAAVSADDEAGLQNIYGPLRTVNVPIATALDAEAPRRAFPHERKLLFIGRLDWRPNQEGLRWLLKEVWPTVAERAPDLSLTIVGAGNGRWLEAFSSLPRVSIRGRVPEVASFYRDTAVALAPVFFGSGTRVKAIEASSFARACISTAIGVEGIGLNEATSYFRAESREDWIRALCSLDLDEAAKRGQRAFEHVSREFDPDRVAERFALALKVTSPNRANDK